jgi:hypothetical protein
MDGVPSSTMESSTCDKDRRYILAYTECQTEVLNRIGFISATVFSTNKKNALNTKKMTLS